MSEVESPLPLADDGPLSSAELDAMRRIESNIPLECFAAAEGFSRLRLWRDGLGYWTGLVGTDGVPEIVIAAAERDDGFGASIWFPQDMAIRDAIGIVMSLITSGPKPKFMTPEGRMIGLTARPASDGTTRIRKARQTRQSLPALKAG